MRTPRLSLCLLRLHLPTLPKENLLTFVVWGPKSFASHGGGGLSSPTGIALQVFGEEGAFPVGTDLNPGHLQRRALFGLLPIRRLERAVLLVILGPPRRLKGGFQGSGHNVSNFDAVIADDEEVVRIYGVGRRFDAP